MTPRSIRLLSCLTLTAACGDDGDGTPADEASSSVGSSDASTQATAATETMPSTGAMAESSSSNASADSTSDDGASSTTDAPAGCGDGNVDEGEECDDGNRVDADGCNVDCVHSGSVRWELFYDAPAGSDGCARDVAMNASGHVAVSGDAESADSADVLTLSINADGTLAWDDVYDSPSTTEDTGGLTDRGYGVAIEDDGEIIVSGHEHIVVETVWVRKYDADGTPLWTRTGDTTHAGRGYNVALGPDGSIFVVGTHGLYAFVTKYNTNGIEFWTQERKGTNGCNGCDYLRSARPLDDGGVIVGGSFDNQDGDTALLRLNADGNDVWIDELDSGYDNDRFTTVLPYGEDTLAALNWGSPLAPEIRSYDIDGNVNWMLPDPIPGTPAIADAITTSDGGFALLANVTDPGIGFAAVVRRFDASGGMLWERRFEDIDATTYHMARGLAVDGNGNIALAGCLAEGDTPIQVWVALLAP